MMLFSLHLLLYLTTVDCKEKDWSPWIKSIESKNDWKKAELCKKRRILSKVRNARFLKNSEKGTEKFTKCYWDICRECCLFQSRNK